MTRAHGHGELHGESIERESDLYVTPMLRELDIASQGDRRGGESKGEGGGRALLERADALVSGPAPHTRRALRHALRTLG